MRNFSVKLAFFILYNIIAVSVSLVIVFYATFFTLIGAYNFKSRDEILEACLGKMGVTLMIVLVTLLLLALINSGYLKWIMNKQGLLKKTTLVEACILIVFVVTMNYINYRSLLADFFKMQQ